MSTSAASTDNAVRVDVGMLSGVSDPATGVRAYLGVPFAAPAMSSDTARKTRVRTWKRDSPPGGALNHGSAFHN